jgi:cellulose synthase/poly-beta-1,6-N-acetylglucosamine synthase-like glycosyltransferase
VFSDSLPWWGMLILAAHFALLVILSLFGLHRMSMVLRWFFHKNKTQQTSQTFETLPKVTVQIPLFNERMVAQRIVDTVVKFEYPRDRLQIQIVDDSTDETLNIAADRVKYYQDQGINISHVTRTNRQGYKAGALKEAMDSATGEFIAIFDADFVPHPSLLKDTIHEFTHPDVGMLQFRWGHLNLKSSKLTEVQGIMLDAHFSLEQQVRSNSGMLLNFNGTAGIWRTSAIIDAGHWSADTLTEDLDLSYRAQLKGWKMRYLNNVVCHGELPADIYAFKSQQHRWAKGGVQVMLKMLGKVWRAPVKLKVKVESTFHLSNNLAYLIVLIDTLIFLLPSIWLREVYQLKTMLWLDIPFLVLSSGGHLTYLVFGQVALKHSLKNALMHVPRLVIMGIQLAFNNANAAVEALRRQESEFVRTPKSGELLEDNDELLELATPESDNLATTQALSLYKAVPPKGALLEAALTVTYSIVFLWAIHQKMWILLPFILLLICGAASATKHSFLGHLKLSK